MKFPYEMYPWQEQMLSFLYASNNRDVIIESPTGSGKTIVSLYYALEKFPDKVIIYLTRTNSQGENLVREAKALGTSKVMSFLGRGEMCLFKSSGNEMSQGDPAEQSQYCRNLIERQKKSGDGCPYSPDYDGQWPLNIMSQTDFLRLGNQDFCPYYAQKKLLESSKVIVTTYSFLLNSFIRERFIEWIGVEPGDIVIIADEAHNIPDLIREMFSLKLSGNNFKNCRKELDQYGDYRIGNIYTSFVFEYLEEAFQNILKEGDRVIRPEDIRDELMSVFQMNSNEIKRILMAVAEYGLSIKESKANENRLPRSYIYNTSNLLLKMMEDDGDYNVRIVHSEEPGFISILYLETYEMLKFLRNFHKVIFISGTISPFYKFKNEMGIENSDDLTVRTDYLENNLKVLFVNDVTSKYTSKELNIKIMRDYIQKIIQNIERNKVIFCTSYEQLNYFLEADIEGRIFFERKGMNNEEFKKLIDTYRVKGGSLFAVINGRISEGIDLPGKLLELAVIAGIPYPAPSPETSSLELFYDMKFRRGWEYAYEAVAATRLRQAIGRLIRKPSDRGVAIILDSRARHFKKYLPNLYLSSNVVDDSINFLNQ